jgi:hypothetical protein
MKLSVGGLDGFDRIEESVCLEENISHFTIASLMTAVFTARIDTLSEKLPRQQGAPTLAGRKW